MFSESALAEWIDWGTLQGDLQGQASLARDRSKKVKGPMSPLKKPLGTAPTHTHTPGPGRDPHPCRLGKQRWDPTPRSKAEPGTQPVVNTRGHMCR